MLKGNRKKFKTLVPAVLVVSVMNPVMISATENTQLSHVVFTIDGKHYTVSYTDYNEAVGLGWIDPIQVTHVIVNGKTFTRSIYNAAVAIEGSIEAARMFLANNTTHIAHITPIPTTLNNMGVVIPQEPSPTIPDYSYPPSQPTDMTAPNVVSATIEGSNNELIIWVEFDEAMQREMLIDPSNFKVNDQQLTTAVTVTSILNERAVKMTIPTTEVQALFGFDPTGQTPLAIVKQIIENGVKVKVQDVKDAAGNVLAGTSKEVALTSYAPIYTYAAIQVLQNSPLSTTVPTKIGKATATHFALKANQTLPAGLVLNSETGQITGTPTELTVNGTAQQFTIEVSYVNILGDTAKTEATVSISVEYKQNETLRYKLAS